MNLLQRFSCFFLLVLVLPQASAARDPFADETARLQFGRDRSIDVRHYRLELRLDPTERSVHGTAAITLMPIARGLQAVELDAGPMEISRVVLSAVEQQESLPFTHDGRTLRVEVPGLSTRTEPITLTVHYEATPGKGLYFVGPDAAYPDKPSQIWSQGEAEDNHHWFPSFDHPSDRATSEAIYTVPAGWTAVGNGELVRAWNGDDGTRSFQYRMDVPHVAYLISVAAGKFERYAADYEGIPVEYFVPEGTGEQTALRSFGPTPDMLRFFSERSGVPYPYPKYSQTCVVDFIFGGMENISSTTQTAETLHDEIAALEFDSWGLVAHEAAHQWWGDLLTCASWSHAWLNEGFATYWENLWWEHAHGAEKFQHEMLRDRDAYLLEDRDEYRRPIVEHRFTDPLNLFDSHLYPKGGWVLHMLRGVLGDEAFFRAIADYTKTYRESVVETGDLRRSVEKSTGRDVGRFFDQWLLHGGHPEIAVSRRWDPDEKLLTLRFEQTQTIDETTPLFWIPLEVAVDTADGTVGRNIVLERAVHETAFRLEAPPLLVRIDPNFFVLMELDHERPPAEVTRGLERDPVAAGRMLAAREAAKKLPRSVAAPALARALRTDSFWGVRVEAAKALAEVGGAQAREALIAALDDRQARVRRAAAKALGDFDDDRDVAVALESLLDREVAYGPTAEAVRSLARIGAEHAERIARGALGRNSHREQIRVAAIDALTEIGDAAALETVLDWTRYGKPPRARTAAIAALPELGRRLDREKALIRKLEGLLDDPYVWARREAIRALGAMHATGSVAALERSSRVETDPRLRQDARQAIREIRSATASDAATDLAVEVERLRRELRDRTERIEELEKRAP